MNVRKNIQSGIYQIDNDEKSCKRISKIILLCLIVFLILSELFMNFKCMIRNRETSFIILDSIFYFGLFIIEIFETIILC